MRGRRSRQEVSLARLLARCQELAATSADLAQEWRLPKFLGACEELLAGLPRAPDPAAPSAEALLGYRSALDLLVRLLPKPVEEVPDGRGGEEREASTAWHSANLASVSAKLAAAKATALETARREQRAVEGRSNPANLGTSSLPTRSGTTSSLANVASVISITSSPFNISPSPPPGGHFSIGIKD